MQLAAGGLGHVDALHLGIVADDAMPASAAADVKLETITTEAQCQIESGDSVLRRRVRNTCSAMTEEERITGHRG